MAADPRLDLGAVWTHLAVADGAEPEDRAFTALQLERFDAVLASLAATGSPAPDDPRGQLGRCHRRGRVEARHGPLRDRRLRVSPTPALADTLSDITGGLRLQPVLSLRSQVTYVRDLDAGERPSYGRRRPLAERSTVATIPIGYADGVPRRLFDQGGDVLIRGIRRPWPAW